MVDCASLIIGTAVTVSDSLRIGTAGTGGYGFDIDGMSGRIVLTFSMLRVIFRIKLAYVLMGVYAVIFTLSFCSKDSCRFTRFGRSFHGAMTVPFLLAFGAGALR